MGKNHFNASTSTFFAERKRDHDKLGLWKFDSKMVSSIIFIHNHSWLTILFNRIVCVKFDWLKWRKIKSERFIPFTSVHRLWTRFSQLQPHLMIINVSVNRMWHTHTAHSRIDLVRFWFSTAQIGMCYTWHWPRAHQREKERGSLANVWYAVTICVN